MCRWLQIWVALVSKRLENPGIVIIMIILLFSIFLQLLHAAIRVCPHYYNDFFV